MEERSKALKQRKEEFYYILATVLQEIDLMRRETNGNKEVNLQSRGKNNFIII